MPSPFRSAVRQSRLTRPGENRLVSPAAARSTPWISPRRVVGAQRLEVPVTIEVADRRRQEAVAQRDDRAGPRGEEHGRRRRLHDETAADGKVGRRTERRAEQGDAGRGIGADEPLAVRGRR